MSWGRSPPKHRVCKHVSAAFASPNRAPSGAESSELPSDAQSVICVSEAVREFAANRLGCDKSKSVVIGNGVDWPRFASAPAVNWSTIGWPEDSLVSLFVGRLHRQKGIELLQGQIDQIAPSGSNQRLLLVGDGPLRSELQSWVDRIGRQRVQLLPWHADVAPLMRACRVLLLPSHYEGMPNVVLETMAAAQSGGLQPSRGQ